MMRPKLWHIFLFAGVIAIIAVNALLLHRTQNSSTAVEQEGDEPAEIELIILSTPDCQECFDVAQLVEPLKVTDEIKITKEKSYEYDSWRGKRVVEQYGITQVPTLLVRGDTEDMFDPVSFEQNLGTIAEDGTLVVTQIPAPYVEVATGQVKGRFTVTYLTDKNCTECYDHTLHQRALEALVMSPAEEVVVDRADEQGQELIERYSIQSTPTILMQGEFEVYPQLQQVWPTVGTIEEDGTYIFREIGQQFMGPYYDLKTEKVITPALPPIQ